MQNNIKRKLLKKLKVITLEFRDRYSTDILEIQKFFGLIILMGIIYTPNILKHWFTDSLYDTPTFQKLWHVIDFIFFSYFYTSVAKQTPAMIPMIGEEAVVTKFAFLLIWNFLVNFAILKSSWVLENHLCYLNVSFISKSI